MKTLVLGGARSGKSAYAEKLATLSALPVTYIATAQIWDDEMRARIRHHQQRRPAHWRLLEEPFHLADALRSAAADGHCVIVDCLTLWLAQWLCPDCQPPADGDWNRERDALIKRIPTLPGEIIFVSNEVGLGIVPLGEINRRFQDEQGRLNQTLAALCDRVVFMAAGLPMVLKESACG
ncbi:MAG: bifunctional adenosylcobinamide kinase/adenosylcobinamide-phosphate guanylyltransferase [Methylobacillus sp.]|jgi:adenosylcobinamide kinase/adenosylcobinamide-phosphate guanylyltransferase|nr:bifunctional adenosylcobinamide kinase/adenosylcobinamide-phosphate guanylyltransferase [Methylobacillus sp.]